MTKTSPLLAGLDAGGTTFKCIAYRMGEGILARKRFKTGSPFETIADCTRFFVEQSERLGAFASMGIAAFGPLNVDPISPAYGTIGDGPKTAWSGINLKAAFEAALNLPVMIDTDVNAALLSEMKWGAAQGCESAAYTTIGTGIGSGFATNGTLLGKPFHPEFGHIRLSKHPADTNFNGVCSCHGDCLEGLASAPAITERFGNPENLPEGHIAWNIIGFYLAQACLSQFLTLRPERIILGGGVMLSPYILPKVHSHFERLLGGYLGLSPNDIDALIVKAGLGDDAGVLGAIALAEEI